MLPVDTTAKAAVSASGVSDAHVYLLRGVLNIFSLGLDDIADKLRAQGIPVTVINYLGWSSLADEVAADYKSGRVRTIILVGHSSGATALPDMVARLEGYPITMPERTTFYGMREIGVFDPAGNIVIFAVRARL